MDYINFILLLCTFLVLFTLLWNFMIIPITLLLSLTRNELIIWFVPRLIMAYLILSIVSLSILTYTNYPNELPILKTVLLLSISIFLVSLFHIHSNTAKEIEYEGYLEKFDVKGIQKLSQYNKFKNYEKYFIVLSALGLVVFRVFPNIADNFVTSGIFNLLHDLYDIKILGLLIGIFCLFRILRMGLIVSEYYTKQYLRELDVKKR